MYLNINHMSFTVRDCSALSAYFTPAWNMLVGVCLNDFVAVRRLNIAE